MTDKAFLFEKRCCQHSGRACLLDSNSDSNKSASFLMPETVLLLPPYTFSTDEKINSQQPPITSKYGLRSSLKHENSKATTTSTTSTSPVKTVHFNVPLTQVLYFYPLNYQNDEDEEDKEDEESQFEDAFLELYSKSFQMDLLDTSFQEMVLKDTARQQLSVVDSLTLCILNSKSRFEHNHSSVYLEQLNWDEDYSVIKGLVTVRNFAFEKSVIARLTFDEWNSYIDINAVYNESPSDCYDRFVFELTPFDYVIQLKEHRDLLSLTCQLAIQYSVEGNQYWDNNCSRNYTFQWLKQHL